MLLSEHDVSKSWHPSKNTLALTDLTIQSGRRVWWVCSEGHEWECRVADRIQSKNKAGTDCPYCAGRKVWIGYNDLASMYPEIASEWHPTKNGDLTPSDFTSGSHMKAWWICKNDHEWLTSIKHRTGKHKTGCVYCAGNLVFTGFNDLFTFAPALAAEWHPIKNNDLYPNQVLPNSHRKVWWLGNCNHEWKAAISSRYRNQGKGCPVCSGKDIVRGFNDLASQYPLVASTWHPTKNGSQLPESTFMASTKKFWWQCSLGHEWTTTVASRVSRNTSCLVCTGRQVLTGFNDLASQYPSIATEWHPTKNGKIKPNEVYAGGIKRYWWQCTKGHEWNTQMQSRTRANGSNCPTCAIALMTSKGESEIAEFLIDKGYKVQQSNRSVFKNKRELDIYLPDHRLAIEFNGLYYHSEEMGKDEQYHRNKWSACSEKGIDLIQVWEDDWNDDPAKIKRLFLKSLNSSTDFCLDDFTVELCSPEEAIEFIRTNTFATRAEKSEMNFKCFDETGLTVAVLALSLVGQDCQIIDYADNLSFVSSQLLTYMLSMIDLNVISYFVHADNCTGEQKVFMQAGFQKTADVEPYPSIMKRDRRVALDRTADGFTYLDNKDEVHLAPSKKLIWDAGKTTFRK